MNRLKDLRQEYDLRQEDVAEILMMSQRNYSYYETGVSMLTLEVLNILADYYNTSIDYIVCRTDIREPYKRSILIKKKNTKYKLGVTFLLSFLLFF